MLGTNSLGPYGVIGLSVGAEKLYMALTPSGGSTSTIYTIDTITGVATAVAVTTAARIGSFVLLNGTLYASVASDNSIVAVDPVTGVTTFVTSAPSAGTIWGLAPAPAQ